MLIKEHRKKRGKSNNQSGLTLIELLVAISIFSLLLVVISGIYVAFSNSQARTMVAQKLLNNAQFALEGMAREIRNNTVLFKEWPCDEGYPEDWCGEPSCPDVTSCFYIKKEDGTIAGFAGIVDEHFLTYIVRDPETNHWATTGFVFLSPLEDIQVDALDFLISPDLDSNPFLEGGPNQHPLVTIRLQVSTETENVIEEVTYNLQTTVSPRTYER